MSRCPISAAIFPGGPWKTRIKWVAARIGGTYPLVIGGQRIESGDWIVSINPSHRTQIIGRCAAATVEQANAAVDAAEKSLPRLAQYAGKAIVPRFFSAARNSSPAPLRIGGMGSLRNRQALARGRCRRSRGDRLLRVLRPRNDPPLHAPPQRSARRRKRLHLRAARRGRHDRAMEFSPRHSLRHDHRRPGHRQYRRHETRRAIADRRRQADGGLLRSRHPRRRRQLSARLRRENRPRSCSIRMSR